MTEFVSRISRIAKAVGIGAALLTYPAHAYADKTQHNYSYVHEISIRRLPQHYLPPGVVAFTIPEESEIVLPDSSFFPYENGRHSEPAVRMHEEYHNWIHRAGGIQDERGINDLVAYKLGYSRFPFASY